MTRYLRKYNKFGMSTLCRICLTQSTSNMNFLQTNLKEDDCSPTIAEALGQVMACKIVVHNKLPSFVCPMCLGLLKIAYELKQTFRASQHSLRRYFNSEGDNFDDLLQATPNLSSTVDYKSMFETNENSNDSILNDSYNGTAPVELVIGDQKYNIKDVVVVEDDSNNEENVYTGFLKNLGSTVSASFSNSELKPKETKEPKPEVLLKKVSKQKLDQHIINEIEIMPLESYDQNVSFQKDEIEVDNSIENAQIDEVKLDEKNLNLDLESMGLNEADLVQSALSMTFQCSRCNKVFMTEGGIRRHVTLCGKELNKLCHICNRVFRCRTHLAEHMYSLHNVKWIPRGKRVIEAKSYTCDVCGQIFRKNNIFRYHLLKHEGKNFMCEVCGKHFYTKHNVNSHMQIHKKRETKVLCPVCGRGFHYQSGLYYHMKLHKNERKHHCTYCDKRFYVLNALKRHLRTHTGQKPYNCTICDKTFASSGELKKHSYLHTSFRPHHCKYCKRGTTSKFNLQIHMMTHPGPYPCEVCERSFADTEILTFHMRHKHNIREAPSTEFRETEIEEEESGTEIENTEEIIESVEVDSLEQFQLLASFKEEF